MSDTTRTRMLDDIGVRGGGGGGGLGGRQPPPPQFSQKYSLVGQFVT